MDDLTHLISDVQFAIEHAEHSVGFILHELPPKRRQSEPRAILHVRLLFARGAATVQTARK